ncbi:MAG: DMT family transporter [Pseudomonadota bacterium]
MAGILCAVAASICWGIGAIFVRLGSQGIKSSTGTFISMLASIMLVCSLAVSMDYDALLALTPMAVLWFSIVGMLSYVLGRGLNYTAIRYIGVGRATPLVASAPLFAVILAVVFTGETVNLTIAGGTLSIVVGLYLVIKSG